jgi:hypothetical protein
LKPRGPCSQGRPLRIFFGGAETNQVFVSDYEDDD